MTDRMIDAASAARACGVGLRVVLKWVHSRRLPSVPDPTIRFRHLVEVADLVRFLDQNGYPVPCEFSQE